MIRVKWDMEELIALEWICLRRKEMTTEDLAEELRHLSIALNRRADALSIIHDDKYRNYNGMKLCYQNMLYVLTDGKEGMPNVNRMMYSAHELWKNNNEKYMTILNGFLDRYW